MTADRIARLKITLDDVKPQVLRRIEVPLTIRLDRLHEVLQAALGWTNSHLYELRTQDVGWGIADPDFGDGPLDARKARLIDVLEDLGIKTMHYLYDFGDGWEHTIKIERIEDGSSNALSAVARSRRSLPARGRRRSLGLRGVPRRPHRPQA
jgi:Plasmid pRiA4b ORF-3-like protein